MNLQRKLNIRAARQRNIGKPRLGSEETIELEVGARGNTGLRMTVEFTTDFDDWDDPPYVDWIHGLTDVVVIFDDGNKVQEREVPKSSYQKVLAHFEKRIVDALTVIIDEGWNDDGY